jgi:geranylgeranyl reductase
LKNPLRVIDRPRLGDHLLERVQRYPNIHISAGTPIVEIGENWAASENAKIGFRYLVGADGSGSIVRKYLGKSNKMYAGIHYVIPGTRSEPLWFFNPQVLGSGYGWILPHRTFVSAGVFFNPKLISSENAREVLHGLLDKHGIDRRKARFEAAPVNCLYRGTRFGNIFLVGDAAGLPSAATGEGISYALVSGEDVALYLLGGKSGFRGIKEIIRYKKRQERILAIFDAFPSLQPIFFSLFVSLIKRPWFQTFFGN